jgi:hypothetical protein
MIKTLVSALGLLVFCTPLTAQSQPLNLTAQAGTLGLGLELGLKVHPAFKVRGGMNYLNFDFETTISQIDYTFEPSFSTVSLLADWHPLGNAFRLTAGMYWNTHSMDIQGTYRKDLLPQPLLRYSSLRDQARVKGTVEFARVAPYLGLGWSSNQYSDSAWGLHLDLGLMFQGSPEVTELFVEDPWGLGRHPVATGFLAEEKQAIQKELDNYEYYPVVSLGLSYRF